jgi:hypothetical protein
MMAPEALADGHHQRGPRHPGQAARRDGPTSRYVISLVSIRKVYEFVLHRLQATC